MADITWFNEPYKGTNVASGFEVVIHGIVTLGDEVYVLCVTEEGLLIRAPLGSIAMDWRYTRQKGWHSIDEVTEGT